MSWQQHQYAIPLIPRPSPHPLPLMSQSAGKSFFLLYAKQGTAKLTFVTLRRECDKSVWQVGKLKGQQMAEGEGQTDTHTLTHTHTATHMCSAISSILLSPKKCCGREFGQQVASCHIFNDSLYSPGLQVFMQCLHCVFNAYVLCVPLSLSLLATRLYLLLSKQWHMQRRT